MRATERDIDYYEDIKNKLEKIEAHLKLASCGCPSALLPIIKEILDEIEK